MTTVAEAGYNSVGECVLVQNNDGSPALWLSKQGNEYYLMDNDSYPAQPDEIVEEIIERWLSDVGAE